MHIMDPLSLKIYLTNHEHLGYRPLQCCNVALGRSASHIQILVGPVHRLKGKNKMGIFVEKHQMCCVSVVSCRVESVISLEGAPIPVPGYTLRQSAHQPSVRLLLS
jgi:hypothetical protein